MYTRPLARLIEELQRLPGIGAKSAQRLALYLLSRPAEEVEGLAEALLGAKRQVRLCSRCFNWSEVDPCEICASPRRDGRTICVVADVRDLLALERTQEYRGLYHVLGGVISPMNGIGLEQLRGRELLARVGKEQPEEVIFAIGPTVEGEVTVQVLARYLREVLPGIRLTQLAFGLPVGAELEFADEVTLARALEGRRGV
ncbi:MAG: recombination mediator RecR [Thermostichales cyanobacterium DRC_bins_46]